MKQIFLLVFILGLGFISKAQDRWTVLLNSNVLLTANAEDTTKNVVKVDDLKKGSLIVTYTPATVENQRKRRIMIYDANDQELYAKEALSIVVPVSSLKKWMLTSPQIKIYTLPVLGEEGANVRLRRVHLATINLE
ncbi:MAG: hypothetical protein EON98_08435 [Chitinophagaceae bacterium]|nr:MAG: hypothetical protein EON98_08435 [Chitinophagaceae bacterium]